VIQPPIFMCKIGKKIQNRIHVHERTDKRNYQCDIGQSSQQRMVGVCVHLEVQTNQ